MKYCPVCKTDKSEGEFYLEPKRPGGLSSNCKECKNERSRRHWKERYYPAHREELIQKVIARREQKTPKACMANGLSCPLKLSKT